MTNFLADAVSIFHVLVILFVILGTFSDHPAVLILHITFLLCLLVHWICNSDFCFLSLAESKLRGIKNTRTFSHQFISPIYLISEYSWNQIVTVVTILLLMISIYRLRNNEKFNKALKCIDATKTLRTNLLCFIDSIKM